MRLEKILIQKALERLGFTNSHRETGLSNTVLTVILGLGCDRYDITAGLLGGVVAVDGVIETLKCLALANTHIDNLLQDH
jgi:hypothetical protein